MSDKHTVIRECGGIVHSDGNIFFTSVEQFMRAAQRLAAQPGEPVASQPSDASSWLLVIMRMAEAAKEPCESDPESPGAIRNSKFANISQVSAQALGWVNGPSLAAYLAAYGVDAAAPLPQQGEKEAAPFTAEWLFANCRIVYFPPGGAYPVEHNPHALGYDKDGHIFRNLVSEHIGTQEGRKDGGGVEACAGCGRNPRTCVCGSVRHAASVLQTPDAKDGGGVEAGSEFKAVGKADFHMSAELDVCIGDELYVRAPILQTPDGGKHG